MNQPIVVYQGKNILIWVIVAVVGFSLGLYLQSGWVDLKPVISAPVAPETTSTVIEQQEPNSLQSLRMERDREQSRQRERFQTMIDSNEPESDLVKQASGELLELERRVTKERELESLLAVRGYPETLVKISATTVTVIVGGQSLSPERVAAIGQWAAEITGRPINQIRIMDQSIN